MGWMVIEEALQMQEVLEVKKLGEKIGYGHLMELASALWRKHLRDRGYPDTGAFLPIIPRGNERELYRESIAHYDDIVEKYLG